MSRFNHQTLAVWSFLGLLALSPTEMERRGHRGIASEEPTPVVKTEEKVTAEAPKTEAPKTEAPKTEEPKVVEAPKTEAPKTETPKVEEPKKEEPKVAEAPKEEPKKEEPKEVVLVVKEEKKDEKKKDEDCDHPEHQAANKNLQGLMQQQQQIMSYMNQMQMQMMQQKMELEYKILTSQFYSYSQPNYSYPMAQPQQQQQPMFPQQYPQAYQSYPGMMSQPQSPFMGQSPMDFTNYWTQAMQSDPRYQISPIQPGDFGIQSFGFNMGASPVSPVPGLAPNMLPGLSSMQRPLMGQPMMAPQGQLPGLAGQSFNFMM